MAVNTSSDRLYPWEAEEQGFTIDHTTYPWTGYKGPRFAPTETARVFTDLEARLLRRVHYARHSDNCSMNGTGLSCTCGYAGTFEG